MAHMIRWAWVGLFLLLLLPAGAQAQQFDPTTEPSAQLRFVHLLSGQGALDLYLNGEMVVAGLPFKEATSYALSATGAQQVAVRPAGAAPDSPALLDQRITVEAGLSYSLLLAQNKEAAAAIFLIEDDTAPHASAPGTVRLVNVVLGQPAIGVTAGEAALSGLLAYGEASPRLPVSEERVSLTIINDQGHKLHETPALPLGAGHFYTIFAVGAGENVESSIVSYPVSAGGLPTKQIWLPLTPGGSAPMTSLPPKQGAAPATVPSTGASLSPSSLPGLLMILGSLLMVGTLIFSWWRSQQPA